MLQQIFYKEEPSSLTNGVKYERRRDIDSSLRLKIASQALFFAIHGTISLMSVKYCVSRTFIYALRNNLNKEIDNLFGTKGVKEGQAQVHWSCVKMLLQLRLVGQSSLQAISELMSNFGMTYSSVGFISETLKKIGTILGNQIEWQGEVVCASDELFYSGHQPILITTEVNSSAILRIDILSDLTKEAWENHWQGLLEGGIKIAKILTDEGTVLQSARQSVLSDVPWQPDSFHAVSHRLGLISQRLSKQVEKANEGLISRENRYFGTKTEQMADKVYLQYLQARQHKEQIQTLYQNFSFLYNCILEQFTLFSSKDASLRTRSYAEMEVKTALEYLYELPIKNLKDLLDDVKRILPHLFNFLDTAKNGLEQLTPIIDPAALPFWLRAWQRQKIAYKIKNKYQKQKALLAKATQDLELLAEFYQFQNPKAFDALTQTIFKTLDKICAQSSAVVENVNSFFRPFLNQARDQISQHTLNVLMFYYNHRPFSRGKKKGKAPIEILSGKLLNKSWLDLIFLKIHT
jgi:hypothetical protein